MKPMSLGQWGILLKERFSPWVYIPTVLALVGAQLGFELLSQWPLRAILLGLLTLWFLFLLRCYDEIKDYSEDLKFKTHRPLARGAVDAQALQQRLLPMGLLWTLATWCVVPQIQGMLLSLVAWLWSLCMYKEFWISSWLKPRLTRYALSHTAVMIPLSLWISSSLLSLEWPGDLFTTWSDSWPWAQALSIWGLFNFFEFGRKTFAKSEETLEMSYSKRFGPWGALGLSFSQISRAWVLWPSLIWPWAHWTLGGLWILIAGIYGFHSNSAPVARLFRGACSLYLLIFLLLHIPR